MPPSGPSFHSGSSCPRLFVFIVTGCGTAVSSADVDQGNIDLSRVTSLARLGEEGNIFQSHGVDMRA